MFLNISNDAMKLVERLRGLRVEVDVARKVQLANLIKMFNDNGIGMGLSHQAQHLGMTFLTKDNNLTIGHWLLTVCIILFFDTFLQLQHHRTSSINYLNIVVAC